MMRNVTRYLRIVLILAVLLLLSTCEFLFYSPAFMPAVSETSLNVVRPSSFMNEFYDWEFTADWSVNTTGPLLQVNFTGNFGRSIPAMESLWWDYPIDPWYGMAEYLGLFFDQGINLNLPTVWTAAPGPSLNHFGQPFNYEYQITLLPSYDLPTATPDGIDGGDGQDSVDYPVSVVEVRVTSSVVDPFQGEGLFIFSDVPEHRGLLYGLYEHSAIGTTVMFYRSTVAATDTEQYFPSGNFSYVIHVFPD